MRRISAGHPRLFGTFLTALGLLVLGGGLAASRYSDALYVFEGTLQDNPSRQLVELVLVIASIVLGLALLIQGAARISSEESPAVPVVTQPPQED
jgi:hypothetical protein